MLRRFKVTLVANAPADYPKTPAIPDFVAVVNVHNRREAIDAAVQASVKAGSFGWGEIFSHDVQELS